MAEVDLATLLTVAKRGHRTTAAAITETLRRAIIQGVIEGGAALRQDDLAAALSVSRMPIREAIRQLEVEGLVTVAPHRGAVAVTLVPGDVEEIAELRVALESLALTLSLTQLTDATLDEAGLVLDAIDREASVVIRGELNRRFHRLLYSGACRPRLHRQIEALYDNFDRYLRLEHSVLDRRLDSQQEHRRLLDACRRRNLAVALGELNSHIKDAAGRLATFLRESPHHG